MTQPAGRKRGYYQAIPGGKHTAPSVTTVLRTIAKDGLHWKSAALTAEYCLKHRQELDELPTYEERYDRARKWFKGQWDHKRDLGTLVHTLADQWARGLDIDLPPSGDCDPYIDALEAFYRDHQPEWLHLERTVICDRLKGWEFAGTFDWIARLADGRTMLGDYKTGKHYEEVHLQLAAYRWADWMAVYDESGTLVDREPMPQVDGAVSVHLNEDGTYTFAEVPASRDDHATFVHLLHVWRALREMAKACEACKARRNKDKAGVPAEEDVVQEEEAA